eukprot:313902-Pyramimonas_sp.AAC.1
MAGRLSTPGLVHLGPFTVYSAPCVVYSGPDTTLYGLLTLCSLHYSSCGSHISLTNGVKGGGIYLQIGPMVSGEGVYSDNWRWIASDVGREGQLQSTWDFVVWRKGGVLFVVD